MLGCHQQGDAKITKTELKAEHTSDADMDHDGRFHVDADGTINFEEFCKMMVT